jgi:hypothetical protein
MGREINFPERNAGNSCEEYLQISVKQNEIKRRSFMNYTTKLM